MINENEIFDNLSKTQKADKQQILDILTQARELKGISFEQTAALLNLTDKDLLEELYKTAKYIKTEIYGNRLVLFAPLYISNVCFNECLYCAFRASNKDKNSRS